MASSGGADDAVRHSLCARVVSGDRNTVLGLARRSFGASSSVGLDAGISKAPKGVTIIEIGIASIAETAEKDVRIGSA